MILPKTCAAKRGVESEEGKVKEAGYWMIQPWEKLQHAPKGWQ
jgi:hypothetical protein